MRAFAIVPVLLVLAVLASGCTRDKVNPYEPATAQDVGGLRVVVQGDHNERVKDAFVLIMPWGESGRTDDLGIVVFASLSPGDGTVRVNADGYYDAQANAHVAVGQNAEVPVLIDRK